MFVRWEFYRHEMTMNRGTAGEAAVLKALVTAGYEVLLPFGEGHAFDLVVHSKSCFVRIQCKTAWTERGAMVFNPYSTDHGRGPGSYEGLVDLFGIFHPPTDSVCLVPIDRVARTTARLRLEPTRNNQKRRITWAAEFEIATWTPQRLREAVSGEQSSSGALTLTAAA